MQLQPKKHQNSQKYTPVAASILTKKWTFSLWLTRSYAHLDHVVLVQRPQGLGRRIGGLRRVLQQADRLLAVRAKRAHGETVGKRHYGKNIQVHFRKFFWAQKNKSSLNKLAHRQTIYRHLCTKIPSPPSTFVEIYSVHQIISNCSLLTRTRRFSGRSHQKNQKTMFPSWYDNNSPQIYSFIYVSYAPELLLRVIKIWQKSSQFWNEAYINLRRIFALLNSYLKLAAAHSGSSLHHPWHS